MVFRSIGIRGQLNDWPDKIREIQAVTHLPVWVTEVGVSTFGAQEVQEFGLRKRTAELLSGMAPRVHWYSLFDLPQAWPATTRHKEAEGSSYYRHFHMGLIREDGGAQIGGAPLRRVRARKWAFASGFTSRIIASKTPPNTCANGA